MTKVLRSALVAAAFATTAPAAAHAADYSVDCALLLCLPGGFPASEPCARAYTTMIRRITPWPIEPPLQPWRCDLSSGGGIGGAIALGPDGLNDETRQIRDSVEIYNVRFSQRQSRDDVHVQDRTVAGTYDEAGKFLWVKKDLVNAPDWLLGETEVDRSRIGKQGTLWVRGVAMRWPDYRGNMQTWWYRY